MTPVPKNYGTRLIDAHLHLDSRIGGSAQTVVDKLLADMEEAGVEHAVVLQLLTQPWSLAEVAAATVSHPRLTAFANIDPNQPDASTTLHKAVAMGYRGVKLHPRLQKFCPDAPACIALVQRAGELDLPVLIDCFPDGDWLLSGLNILNYANLARVASGTRLIVAHAGGHHCIDLLMLAKRIPNLWFDLSYSWLYYDDSVVSQLAYCVRSMRGERVLFGTDYPDRPLDESVQRSLALLDRHGVTGGLQSKILWHNAQQLLRLN